MQAYEADICCDQRVCGFCEPKTILTMEEEVALAQMREIRNNAVPIMDRLSELKTQFSRLPEEGASAETKELQAQLEILRDHWRGWQQKLEQAIENKLIALGHKFPVS
jgi:hypothetical protein